MFGEDSKTENWLHRRGIKFDYKNDIRFDELKPDWDVINHGRPDKQPIDEDLVVRYADCMTNNDIFPAPLLIASSVGFEVLDGCQRLSAAKLNEHTAFNAYVLASSLRPEVRQNVRVCVNQANGKLADQRWFIGKVVETMYDHQGRTAKECADFAGVTEKRILDAIAVRSAKRSLERVGVDVTLKPACNDLFCIAFSETLGKYDTSNDRVKKAIKSAVVATQRAKLNNGESVGVLEQYSSLKQKQGTNPATQIESVTRRWTNEPDWASRIAGKRKLHPVENAIRAIRSALSSVEGARKDKIHADPTQSMQIVELLTRLKSECKKVVDDRDCWASPSDIIA